MKNKLYWIWFQNAVGIGASLNNYLRDCTIEQFYNKEDYSFLKIGEKRLAKLLDKDLSKAEKTLKICEEKGYRVLTPDMAEYPRAFNDISGVPAVLYVLGDMDFNATPMVSVIGARKASKYSVNVATRLAYSLATGGVCVVSGGALGVDSASHAGALAAGGKTVVILGCGLDVEHLKSNEAVRRAAVSSGALVSEFPPGTAPSRNTFPLRNRLIAALSLGTVVIQAGKKSGSLITVRDAKSFGRDVFAVPGGIYNPEFEGINNLLKDGAKAVFGVRDILEEYKEKYPEIDVEKAAVYDISEPKNMYDDLPTTKIESVDNKIVFDLSEKKQFPDLSPKTRLVYDSLEFGARHVNEISAQTGLTLGEVLSHLTSLELIDAVRAVEHRVYEQI